MTMKSFASGEAITAANWNAMVDQLPGSMVYLATPQATNFSGGGSASADAFLARVKLRPVQGDFLFLRFEAQRGSGNTTGDVVFKLRVADTELVGEVARQTVTAASYTKFALFSIDLRAMPVIGDATSLDCDLEIYTRSTPNAMQLRSLYVASSMHNSLGEVWQ